MPKFVFARVRLLGATTLLLACAHAQFVNAAPSVSPSETALVVNTTSDVINKSDGKLSLREAITQANSGDGGFITFNFGASGNMKTQTLQINAVLPAVTRNVVISNTRTGAIIINGRKRTPQNRQDYPLGIFSVAASGSLALNAIQIENGTNLFGNGAAILNLGRVSLNACALLDNSAKYGGAIYNAAGATLEATNTTFAENEALGDIIVDSIEPRVGLQQSTSKGDDIQNLGKATLINCTMSAKNILASNHAIIVNNAGTLSLWNTILSSKGGTQNKTLINANGGTITSLGHNLAIDNGSGFLTATGDQTNTDPKLGELSRGKGDLVSTFPLGPDSPARNSGDTAVFFAPVNLSQDARGQIRLQGSAVDIGAVEMANAVPSGRFAARVNGKVGTPLKITTSWRDADGAADILGAQVFFAPSALKTGPVLRVEQSGENYRIFLVSDGPRSDASLDITEAALAGTASSRWFDNLKAQLSRQSDGVLSVEWAFTPLEALLGQRKAFLSAVDRNGAGGIGPGAPFGALNITKAKGNKADKSGVSESSVNAS